MNYNIFMQNLKNFVSLFCLQLPIAILMVLNNDIFLLLNFVAFIEWIMNFLAVAIIPYYRWKHPDLHRPFKV